MFEAQLIVGTVFNTVDEHLLHRIIGGFLFAWLMVVI